jgi:hypothetical protein
VTDTDGEVTTTIHSTRLRADIAAAEPRLRAMADAVTAERPAPGKWSPREIIGHLVDSASNNHARFVRAADRDGLVFDGYAQDDWVSRQRYQDADWGELLTLWAAFNRHLARVMEAVPERVRTREHARHNLDQVAFRPIAAGVPATLDWFMEDYVLHLEHHLRQVLGEDRFSHS